MRLGPVRFLLLLILLLAGGLTSLWFDKHAKMRSLEWVAPKALVPEVKIPANPSNANTTTSTPALFATILERPIFAPDRRPSPPPPPPAPPDPLANIQIQGIFSGLNAGVLARIDGKVRRIKVNDTIGPWTLKDINGRSVTFVQGDETRQLYLAYARIDTLTPQAAPTATVQTPGNPAANTQITRQNNEDAGRENIRRRNEIRAARGLPLIKE